MTDREPPPVLHRRPAPPAPRRRTARPPVGRRARGRRRGSWLARLTVVVLLVAVAAAAGAVGAGVWLETALQRAAVFTDYPDRPAAGPGTTWLLVGSDSREGLTAEQQRQLSAGGDVDTGRTDTLLLIHVPAPGSATPTTVVSIPRDSYVPVPGYGRDKINAAYALGGAQLLTETVEQATGLRLDHYIEIGFAGFADVVDALGGVTLCPDEPIDDPLAGVDLPAGCQSLGGRAALGYVRSRATPRADLDRMGHQRLFLSALLRRGTDPAVWLNPVRWYTVPHAAARAVTVDRDDHVWNLAALGWALHGPTTTLTVPIGEFADTDAGDAVVWDHTAAAQLFDALSRDEAPPVQ